MRARRREARRTTGGVPSPVSDAAEAASVSSHAAKPCRLALVKIPRSGTWSLVAFLTSFTMRSDKMLSPPRAKKLSLRPGAMPRTRVQIAAIELAVVREWQRIERDQMCRHPRDVATAQGVAMFVSSSSVTLEEAEPVGALTTKDRQTLDLVLQAGGTVTATEFAHRLGIEQTTAGNRLVSLHKKGYLQRIVRPHPVGDLFIDARSVRLRPGGSTQS
jgi:hypothetical protein